MKRDLTAILVLCGVVATVAIVAIAVMKNIQFVDDGIPDGLPIDYFENIQLVEASHVEIYVYSDTIDFNGDCAYIPVTTLAELPIESSDAMRVLVLDMNKSVEDEFATPQQLDRLFEDDGYQIFIVNYESSASLRYDGLMDRSHTYSDLIQFTHDVYGNDTIGSMSGDVPTEDHLMYFIIHGIKMILLGI